MGQHHEHLSEQRWQALCNAQGWNEASQIIHLEGFLRQSALFAQFSEYAEAAAMQENADQRWLLLEDLGYKLRTDPDQPDFWVWTSASDSCEVSQPSEAAAVEAAWSDAVQQAQSILVIASDAWAALSIKAQIERVRSALQQA